MKTKSALSYFGSDSEVAERLAAKLGHCKHVTIPFVGGGSIIPHLKARAIVCNDLNESAITFYRVVSGVFGATERDALIKRCRRTLSHPHELITAHRTLIGDDVFSPVDHAWAYWSLCWVARKGQGGTKNHGGLPSVRRSANGGTNASRIRAAADDLEAWAETFNRCEWEQVDFRVQLSKVRDEAQCGIYCDPPWVGAGNSYLHNFTETDHRELADHLHRFGETAVVIRYGDATLIRDLYPTDSWHWTEVESRTQSGAKTGEVWITRRATL